MIPVNTGYYLSVSKQTVKDFSMKLSLRRFEENDLAQLHGWSNAVGSYKYMQKVTPLNYESPEDLERWGMEYVWYAILLEGRAIGGVWVDRRRPGDTTGILGIIIGRPDVLGRGIGRRAIGMAIEKAVDILKVTRIRLTVRQANERAVRSYRSVGFEISGEGTTALSDGTSVPFYRMEMETDGLAEAI